MAESTVGARVRTPLWCVVMETGQQYHLFYVFGSEGLDVLWEAYFWSLFSLAFQITHNSSVIFCWYLSTICMLG